MAFYVLVSAGTKLIFFLSSWYRAVGFGFSMKTVLITH